MKIIDVAEFYADQGGGVKTYINQKLQAGADMGHEIVIVAPGRRAGEEHRYGGRVIWVPGPALPVDPRYTILWRQKQVHRILDAEQPDIVEGSSPWTGGWFAGRWNGQAVKSFIFHQDPVAVYPHTMLDRLFRLRRIDHLFGFYWGYLRKLSNKFDVTVVSGSWLEDRLSQFNINNPQAVPFGIDKEYFSSERRNEQLRSELLSEMDLPENAGLMIGISRHHPEKRLGTIIDGFKKASQHSPMGLILYGDGPIRKWVRRKANGIPNVLLKGFTSDREELANTLASADYFIHGSAAETYGLVVAEAVCSGLPVVVPSNGGASDLADPEYSETYEPGNSDDLEKAILRIINRDRKNLVEACNSNGKNGIYTMNDHFKKLFDLYQKLHLEKLSGNL